MARKNISIKLNYVVYSTPDKVFEALTDSKIIARWCEGGGKVSSDVGGIFEFFDGWVKGEVNAYNPGKKLSYTWKPGEWDKKTPPSLVTYLFHKHAAGTEIILEHSDFPSQEEADKHQSGWVDYVFEPLNDYFTS